MIRRNFLKLLGLSAASTLPVKKLFAIPSSHLNQTKDSLMYPLDEAIELKMFIPDVTLGHKLRDHQLIRESWKSASEISEVDTLIAGAGVAGLSCAYHLHKQGKQFLIIDPLDRAGGTSAAIDCGEMQVPIGAHYLMTPPTEATEIRLFLKEIGAIEKNISGLDIYRSDLLLNSLRPQERSFYINHWTEGIGDSLGDLPQSVALRKFHKFWQFLSQLKGNDGRRWFSIPTEKSSRDPKALELFDINFVEYLKKAEIWDEQVEYVVNFACMDDYGCLANEVSAWLGWHYFACRPYSDLSQTLTSVSGNGWLVEELQSRIPKSSKQWSTVLASIRRHPRGLECLLTNSQGLWWKQIVKKLVYAGKNHVLKHLCSEKWYLTGLSQISSQLLKNQKLWLTTQIQFNKLPADILNSIHWDNVDVHSKSVGYIHANHQDFNNQDQQVITHYFPVSAKLGWHNKELFNQSPAQLKQLIIDDLYHSSPELIPYIAKMIFRPTGHAMSIPTKNQRLPSLIKSQSAPAIGDLILCNSDSYGLPLFEEAFQAGYNASQSIAKIR